MCSTCCGLIFCIYIEGWHIADLNACFLVIFFVSGLSMTGKLEGQKALATASSRMSLEPTMPCVNSMAMNSKAATYELITQTESSCGAHFPTDHFDFEIIVNVGGNTISWLELSVS